jgi:hypothetical protein
MNSLPGVTVTKKSAREQPTQKVTTESGLKSWVQHSIVGAIHFFAGRDGVCRKFQREICAHTRHNQATVNRSIQEMLRTGALILVQQGQALGNRGQSIPNAYRLGPSVRDLFPKLSSYRKDLIRRVSAWPLEPGQRIKKSGLRTGEIWRSSSPQSQVWVAQVIAMNAQPPNDEAQIDLEELARQAGFKKKTKAATSSVSLIGGDLEIARRIARRRQFDATRNGACAPTVWQLAGRSGFIPKATSTAPALGRKWPADPAEWNATKLYNALRELARGLHKPVKVSTRGLAQLAYPDVKLKEGMRRTYRSVRVLKKKGVLRWTPPREAGRYDIHGNTIPNTYELVASLEYSKMLFPNRARWFEAELKKRNLSMKKFCAEPGAPAHHTALRIKRGEGVNDGSLERVRLVLSKPKYGPPIQPHEIPTD